MIIPNKLIKLEYDPTKDILFVEWPDFKYFALPELHHILGNIIETVRHYDIKYLLIDARTTVVSVSDTDYNEIALKFSRDLKTTRLKKLARLATDSSDREMQVKNVKAEAKPSVDIATFGTVDEALDWFKM